MVMLTSGMTPNPQPCIICGGSVARLWSVHSHVGDRYLRINPGVNMTGGMKVDFAGVVNIENATTDVDGNYFLAGMSWDGGGIGFVDKADVLRHVARSNTTVRNLFFFWVSRHAKMFTAYMAILVNAVFPKA